VTGAATTATKAFTSEVGTGSREENPSKQKIEPRSDPIGTEKALGREAAQTKVGEVSALSRGSPATHNQNNDEDGWWPPNPPERSRRLGRGE
jgi:hypothetical protein